MLRSDSTKKEELSHTPSSSSAFSGVIMKRTSFLSAIYSLAVEFVIEGFIFKRAVTFFIRSGEPASASFILTLFFAACSSAGIRTRLLSSKSKADVVIMTSRFASRISSRTREMTFERPLRAPVIS